MEHCAYCGVMIDESLMSVDEDCCSLCFEAFSPEHGETELDFNPVHSSFKDLQPEQEEEECRLEEQLLAELRQQEESLLEEQLMAELRQQEEEDILTRRDPDSNNVIPFPGKS